MDILVITFNQDAYGPEAARAETWVNGKLVGTTDIQAVHKDGAAQAVVFMGDFGTGPKSVSVFFKNDAWGGSASTDRNLWVVGMTYNGRYLAMPIKELQSTGDRFDYVIPGDAVPALARGKQTLLINDWTKLKVSPTGSADSWSNSMPPGANRQLNAGTEDQWYVDSTQLGRYNPYSFNAAKNLIISAMPAKLTGGNPGGYTYNSGCLSSDGFFQQQFGYFSLKAKLCAGAGWWPAFWMLPSKNNFQYTHELDIFEQWQGDTSYVQQTLIGPQAGMSEWPHRNVRPTVAGGAEKAFHTYAVDWRKDKTTFYLDDVQTGQFDTPPPMQDGPMYILLDLAVGKKGSWVTSPADGAVGTFTIGELAAWA